MKTLPCLLASSLLVLGCASVDPEPSLRNLERLSEGRTPGEVVWVRSAEEAAYVKQRVEEMLEDGLTRDEALRIAILDSPHLQAQLQQLGIAAADVVEASRPMNPVLDGFLASPRSTGDSTLGLVAWLSDLWQIPRRSRVAELRRQQTELRVAAEVLRTALQAASSWDRLVTAREHLRIERSLLENRRKAFRRHEIRFAHGLDSTGDVELARQMEAEQENAVRLSEQELSEAGTSLEQLLAIEGVGEKVSETATVTGYPEPIPDLHEALTLGLEERLDLALAEAEVRRRAAAAKLQDALIWEEVVVGVEKEGLFRRVRGEDDSIGPAISIELPLFDQKQGPRARAKYELQQAIQMLEASHLSAAKSILDAHRACEWARENLETLESATLPAARAHFDYVREWNGKMQVPFLEVLEAEERLLAAQLSLADARFDATEARRRLWYSLRGGL